MQINIALHKNRLLVGTLVVINDAAVLCGPIDCLGRADQYLATKANNPTRDPALPMGDTPLGTFTGTIVPAGEGLRSYGPFERILLTPPPEGRSGIMIHGGAPGSGGGLRPTEGCVRVKNEDMLKILSAFKSGGEVVITNA